MRLKERPRCSVGGPLVGGSRSMTIAWPCLSSDGALSHRPSAGDRGYQPSPVPSIGTSWRCAGAPEALVQRPRGAYRDAPQPPRRDHDGSDRSPTSSVEVRDRRLRRAACHSLRPPGNMVRRRAGGERQPGQGHRPVQGEAGPGEKPALKDLEGRSVTHTPSSTAWPSPSRRTPSASSGGTSE